MSCNGSENTIRRKKLKNLWHTKTIGGIQNVFYSLLVLIVSIPNQCSYEYQRMVDRNSIDRFNAISEFNFLCVFFVNGLTYICEVSFEFPSTDMPIPIAVKTYSVLSMYT